MSTLETTIDLTDPAFIQRARALRIVARRVAPGGRWAERRSMDRGAGLEFRDYRAYAPGDDLRAIDWNIYRRLGRVVIRLFEELEDLPIYMLADCSGSMWMEQPPRAHAAMRAVMALAAIGLDQHDAVAVMPFADTLDVHRARAGRGRLFAIADSLMQHAAQTQRAAAATNLCAALEHLRALRLRDGLLVVASDFFDPAGAEAIINQLKSLRHRLLLLPIVRSGDASPTLDGDVRVRDCESGELLDVSVTADVRDRYRRSYERHMGALDTFCRSRHAGFLPIDADVDVIEQFATLFQGGRFET